MSKNLIKFKNKITKQNNKTKQQVLTDVAYDLTCKMAQDKNLTLPKIYSEQFAEYYYNYLKQIDANVKTKEQATEQLNADFIKNVQGNVMPLLNKQRCINNAYSVFTDICASCRLQIKQKYGVDNYYTLAKSENKQAKQEYYDFESWAIEAENKFNLYDEKVNNLLTQRAQNPKEFMSTAMSYYNNPSILFMIIIGGGALLVVGGYYLVQYTNEYNRKYKEDHKHYTALDMEDLAQYYGFKNDAEMYDYINDYITVLPQEEKQALINAVLESYKLSTAHDNGFNTVQEAITTANASASVKTKGLEEALTMQANKYSNAQDAIAHKFGLADFKSAVTYLNVHKILIGNNSYGNNGNAGWSTFEYDSLNAKLLAKELNDLDNYQMQAITAIKQQGWPQQVTDYGEYNDMMNQMNSVDIIKQLYFDKMLNTKNYGYGLDNVANATYSDLVDKVGVENANKYANIPVKSNALGDAVTPAQTSSIIDNLDASALLFAGCGITAGATLRCLPGIKTIITNIKSNKLIKKLNKHNKQLEQDNNEIER